MISEVRFDRLIFRRQLDQILKGIGAEEDIFAQQFAITGIWPDCQQVGLGAIFGGWVDRLAIHFRNAHSSNHFTAVAIAQGAFRDHTTITNNDTLNVKGE